MTRIGRNLAAAIAAYLACSLISLSVMAAEPPPSPMVAETWACSYKDGKDWDDKAKARDYLVSQMEKAGLAKTQVFHWTQLKGMAPVDTVWFELHESFGAYAAAADAYNASGIGDSVDAQFDKVEDCTAGLSTIRPFHQKEGDDGDGSSLTISLACNLKHGRSGDDVPSLAGHMGRVMTGFGADGPDFAAVRQPITAGPNYPDLFIFSVFEDTSHWVRYIGQLFGTDEGADMRHHLDMVVDCNLSMWDVDMIVTPDS